MWQPTLWNLSLNYFAHSMEYSAVSSHSGMKLPAFMNTKVHYQVHMHLQLLPPLRYMDPVLCHCQKLSACFGTQNTNDNILHYYCCITTIIIWHKTLKLSVTNWGLGQVQIMAFISDEHFINPFTPILSHAIYFIQSNTHENVNVIKHTLSCHLQYLHY
jgi:hypothetical protein